MNTALSSIMHTMLSYRLLVFFVSLSAHSPLVLATNTQPSDTFAWNSIPALKYLKYTNCYGDLECARLEVPLDWANTSNPNKVGLAIARLPATVSPTDPSFGGTILLNPGGPGGSGIDWIRLVGHDVQAIVSGDDRHYEVLSWDPRGVQFTTPSTGCFVDDWQRNVWEYKKWSSGGWDSSEFSFNQLWSEDRGFGALCEQAREGVYPDGWNIRQFVSTALTARDMVEIIDQAELQRPHPVGGRQQSLTNKPKPLLNYWGVSYGTYLGNTFASMFPSRIGRMLLDGNVDADDYTKTSWLHNLQDNNRTMRFFYEYCFYAGSQCRLRDERITNPAALEAKVMNLLDDLEQDPISFVYGNTADVVSRYDVVSLIHQSSYQPGRSWKELDHILSDLIHGNTSSIISHLKILSENLDLARACLSKENHTQHAAPYPFQSEASTSILCGDGDDITSMTKRDSHARLKRFASQSRIVGSFWAANALTCIHWPRSLRPVQRNRFVGPFGSNLSDYDSRASPLLLIGNTADPVTPLKNAFRSASKHEGSRVLIQNTPGHGSGYLNPSSCTFAHVKRFFVEGILPDEGTQCEGDMTPWGQPIEH